MTIFYAFSLSLRLRVYADYGFNLFSRFFLTLSLKCSIISFIFPPTISSKVWLAKFIGRRQNNLNCTLIRFSIFYLFSCLSRWYEVAESLYKGIISILNRLAFNFRFYLILKAFSFHLMNAYFRATLLMWIWIDSLWLR